MNFKTAKKIKIQDEVTVKETGEVVKVTYTSINEYDLKHPTVFIETINEYGHWQEYMHTEIK